MIKRIIRIILAIISAVFLIWFIIPVFWGIWHIGNMVGVTLCTAIFFRTCFAKLYHRLKRVMCAIKATKILLRIIQFGATAVVVYCTLVSAMMVYAMIPRSANGKATAIVLGAQVKPSGASALLRQRIDAAEDYLNKHPDAKAVVTGGKGDNEPISEAKSMYENMVKDGIDSDRIYQEDHATNTYENIRFSIKILEDNDLSKNIAVVTDSYHQMRARLIALLQRSDIDTITPVNTNNTRPAAIASYPSYFVREWLAIPVEFLK